MQPHRWLSSVSYWTPTHFVESAWVEHAPFAFWLMDAAQPRTVVELGSHLGYSLFVLGDAVLRLGLNSVVYGVDSWDGDDHAGFYGQEVFDAVAATVASEYADQVQLRRGYFSDLVCTFDDGSIDLLHIDGRHGYDDVLEDFTSFLPKLSKRAIVIMHDTFEFQEGFGVHRFWSEVSRQYPSFEFEHGHGLGVLAVGQDAPARVTDFVTAAEEDPAAARDAYARIGARLAQIAGAQAAIMEQARALDETRTTVHRLETEVDHLDDERATLVTQIVGLEQTLSEIRHSTSWVVTKPIRAVGGALARVRCSLGSASASGRG